MVNIDEDLFEECLVRVERQVVVDCWSQSIAPCSNLTAIAERIGGSREWSVDSMGWTLFSPKKTDDARCGRVPTDPK